MCSTTVCWHCKKSGHLSREGLKCRKSITCYGYEVADHLRTECPEHAQTNISASYVESHVNPYADYKY